MPALGAIISREILMIASKFVSPGDAELPGMGELCISSRNAVTRPFCVLPRSGAATLGLITVNQLAAIDELRAGIAVG